MMNDLKYLVFIYGTLRKGGRAHHLMKKALFKAHGSVSGRLVHVDEYPGLIFCEDQQVHGELYEVGDSLLRELDRYEGCFESPAHYVREKVVVLLENGESINAEVYRFNLLEPHHERIIGGDWIKWKIAH